MDHLKGCIYLFCAFTLAGTSVIAAHFLSPYLGTFTITAVSLFFAVAFLMTICRKKLLIFIKQLSMGEWALIVVQALFGIFLFRLFLLQGLLNTTSGEAGILTGATPAFTAIFAWLVLKETLNKEGISGIVLTVAGVLLIQGILLPGNKFKTDHLIGNLLVLCAAMSEAIFNIFSRVNSLKTKDSKKEAIDPVIQTALVSALAFIFCIVPSLFEHPASHLASIGLTQWLALVWYGVVVTALAFIFWYAGIKRCKASVAAAFSGMMPFSSLLLSVLILHENTGWQQWLGGLFVIGGLYFIGKQPAPKAPKSLFSPDRIKT